METVVIEGNPFKISSDVLVKSKRNSQYRYCRKIGKKYIMSKDNSLKYIATLLWYMNNKDGHVVLALKSDEGKIVTCIYHQRMYDYYTDEILDSNDIDRYMIKFRDVYITIEKYFLYSNIDLPDANLQKVDRDFLLKLGKSPLTASQIVTTGILSLIAVILAVFIYGQVKPKPKKAPVKVETYDDVYRSYVTASIESTTVNAIKKILGIKKGDYERISAISGDKITITSAVYRPSYNNSGLVYKKDYPLSEIQPALSVNIRSPWPCPRTVPELYRVVDYKEENIKGSPYRVKTVTLNARLTYPEEIIPLLYVSVDHCVAVTKIEYNEEVKEVKIEAVKYYKAQ